LDFFQKECDPLFPFIKNCIQQLETYIYNGMTSSDFGPNVNFILERFNTTTPTFESVFQAAYNAAHTKFLKYLSNHPARSLFKAAQIFDSRYVQLASIHHDIQLYGNEILQLSNPS
ncbi:7243_t:CDS:1, partial [Cetraspora pellucida]